MYCYKQINTKLYIHPLLQVLLLLELLLLELLLLEERMVVVGDWSGEDVLLLLLGIG